MSERPLVLSLFPGIGLLDMAFEEEGFCVVRGPDVLWGGDVHRFHPPAARFDGVIGGPPCKWWSSAANIAKARGQNVQPDLIPEYIRVVQEAQPQWWVMENVRGAPVPEIPGYRHHPQMLDAAAFGSIQRRVRRITFGTRDGTRLRPIPEALTAVPYMGTVTTGQQRWDALRQRPRSTASVANYPDACEAQGLPRDFLEDSPLTARGKYTVVANGVPLPMGRAIARAVKAALGYDFQEAA